MKKWKKISEIANHLLGIFCACLPLLALIAFLFWLMSDIDTDDKRIFKYQIESVKMIEKNIISNEIIELAPKEAIDKAFFKGLFNQYMNIVNELYDLN